MTVLYHINFYSPNHIRARTTYHPASRPCGRIGTQEGARLTHTGAPGRKSGHRASIYTGSEAARRVGLELIVLPARRWLPDVSTRRPSETVCRPRDKVGQATRMSSGAPRQRGAPMSARPERRPPPLLLEISSRASTRRATPFGGARRPTEARESSRSRGQPRDAWAEVRRGIRWIHGGKGPRMRVSTPARDRKAHRVLRSR